MRFTKITGTFLKFATGERIATGVSYTSQDLRLDQHQIFVRTFGPGGTQLETVFQLQGPGFLDFVATTADAKIPPMSGHFLNTDYDECIVSAELPDQKLRIAGVLTKLDPTQAISTKTVTDFSEAVVGILQERVELISEDEFKKSV